MRTQSQNPAYRRFKDSLPSTKRYPSKDAHAYWNSDGQRRVKDVEIVYSPQRLMPSPAADREFCAACKAYTDQWELDGDFSMQTPENLFGWLVLDGFTHNDELKRALEEFAHIEECEWARQIVKGYQTK